MQGMLRARVSRFVYLPDCALLFLSKRRTIQGTDLRCKKEYRDLLPSFPGSISEIFSPRSFLTHPELIGAKDYRLLESSISTIITRFEQCKSLEEKEKAIVDVKADTACLNDVGVVLIRVVSSDINSVGEEG